MGEFRGGDGVRGVGAGVGDGRKRGKVRVRMSF